VRTIQHAEAVIAAGDVLSNAVDCRAHDLVAFILTADVEDATGFGEAAVNALYAKTVGPALYKNTGTATNPTWIAQTIDSSGAGAPTDGVTDGTTGHYYRDTTAYAVDPETGWYVCADGAADTWTAVTVLLHGTATPTDGPSAASEWTGADLTLLASPDGDKWLPVHKQSDDTEVTIQAGGARHIVLDPLTVAGLSWIKFRSGTTAAPVAQAAARTIRVALLER
jgi:hypothetical protein